MGLERRILPCSSARPSTSAENLAVFRVQPTEAYTAYMMLEPFSASFSLSEESMENLATLQIYIRIEYPTEQTEKSIYHYM